MLKTAKTDMPYSSRLLRREIAAALLVKMVLLWGLWYLAFRHEPNAPVAKPDIARLFAVDKAPANTQP